MQVNNSNRAISPQRFSARTQAWSQAIVMLGAEATALHMPAFWGLTPHPAQYEILALGWLLWFGLARRIYTERRPLWNELLYVMLAAVVIILLAAGLALASSTVLALGDSIQLFVYVILAVLTGRLAAHQLLKALGLWVRPTLIFGDGNNAIQACLALRSEPWMGMSVQGFASLQTGKAREIPANLPANFAWQDNPESWQLIQRYYQCVIAVEPIA